jgi:hypothetical protein
MPKAQVSRSTMDVEVVAVSERQRQGRAANAVAELLMRKLLVPKIYLEPRNIGIDVLAVDRAGSGDIHGVRIDQQYSPPAPLGRIQKELCEIVFHHSLTLTKRSGFHFKYIAVKSPFVDFLSKKNLFAEDGIGRVGIIEIIEHPSAPPQARIAVPPERFRVALADIKKFDEFQKKTPADMEIRG